MTTSTTNLRELLTDRDLAVLADIQRFRLLNTRQIQRLHFQQGHASLQAATRATHRVLQRLESHSILMRLERRIGGAQRGSAGSLWQLGTNGGRLLDLSASSPKRSRYREPTSSLFVHHTIAIAEAAVEIIDLVRRHQLDLLSLQPEPHSWRQFLGRYGQLEWLRPDLYVVVGNQDFEQHTFLEIDRATEHAPQLLRKCQTYARFAAVGAAEHQAGVIPRVLWVVPDTARQSALQRIITGDASLPDDMFTVVTTDQAAQQVVAGLLTPESG